MNDRTDKRSIDRITRYLSTHFAHVNTSKKNLTEPERAALGALEAWVSIIGNTALCVVKLFAGFLINSVSMIVDAFHTLSDIITSVIVLIGFKMTKKPIDEDHPYGHGRAEPIATFTIAILLMVVAFQFLYSSVERFIANISPGFSVLALGTMIFSAVFKEWMARFSFDLGRVTHSQALVADAWHHRSDGIASVFVVIAIIGALFNFGRLDAIFGVGIAALIMWVGFGLARQNANILMEKAPHEDVLKKIREAALAVEGVLDVHNIRVRSYGSYQSVELHALVDKKHSIVHAHSISHDIQEGIRRGIDRVTHVTVHIEPHE